MWKMYLHWRILQHFSRGLIGYNVQVVLGLEYFLAMIAVNSNAI